MTPVRWSSPTLADYLGSVGYATAGFAANVLYCSYDTHLDQGFTHFEIMPSGDSASSARPGSATTA